MKKLFLLAGMTALYFFAGANARAACPANMPLALEFAVADLAIQSSDGFPLDYLAPAGRVVSPDQVCDKLVSSSTTPSKQDGYTDISLRFPVESCVISLKIAADGRVADFTPFTCFAN